MSAEKVDNFDASEWPRDFDVRAEVAEQAELIDVQEAQE